MNPILNFFKLSYKMNKKLFFIALLVVLALAVTACSKGNAGTYAPPPTSNFVGGGCGG